ncbi:MAG: alkaline phosphatase family protein [Bacteroidales bacterium]|jgi:hypothetical protein
MNYHNISHKLNTLVYVILLCCFLISPAGTKAQPVLPKEPPSLVVGIVVDGLRADWIDRYWHLFGEGGIKKLVTQGLSFSDANIPFLMADIGSSHASISTGSTPALHGIISAKWYNRLSREEVFCTADQTARPVGTLSLLGRHSPRYLLTPTINDVLLLASNNRSKVVTVSLQPESSVLLAGHQPSSCYWFNSANGKWMTSSHYMEEIPQWVNHYNQRNIAEIYIEREWNQLLADNLYEIIIPDDNPFETGFFNRFKTFPYKMARIRKESLSQDFEILTKVPFGNTLVADFAKAAMLEENLGTDKHPDILWVSFTAIHQLNLLFGPDSREVADALLRLDIEIQRLIHQVEETVGRDSSLFILTSTHGVSRDPDYNKSLKLPGGYFRYRNAMALLNSYLTAIYGEGDWVENYINLQVYLNETLIDSKNIPFLDIQEQAARFLTHFEGVSRAIPADRLVTGAVTQPWADLLQNSFYPDRTGDLILILQPGWIQEENTDSDSGSPHSYDRHIPMVWYGWGINPGICDKPVTPLDITPTLSRILNIPRPEGSVGNIIRDILQ